MGKLLSALLHLQSIETQLRGVRGRLRVRENSATAQQRKIDQLRDDWEGLHAQVLQRRKEADNLELDLKTREQKVSSLSTALNTTKTNKEYAAILTEINTLRADNAKLEDRTLKVLQEVDAVKAQADEAEAQIQTEQQRLEEIVQTNTDQITKLNKMVEELMQKRAEAAAEVPPEERALFERIAANRQGQVMAPLEVHGKKPPYDYICGGCFISLNAEHANALRSRDEIRTCDNCGCILYMDAEAAQKI